MAKTVKQKDALERIVDQFDKSCAAQESLFGPDGLPRCLAIRNAAKKWSSPSPTGPWEKSVCRHVWRQGKIVRKKLHKTIDKPLFGGFRPLKPPQGAGFGHACPLLA